MKCTNCGEYRETVQDVRACRRCQDGTAQQIHPDTDAALPLTEVIDRLPGLANRFLPGSAPIEVEPAVEEPVVAPVVDEPPKEGIVAKVTRVAKKTVTRKSK